MVAIYGEKSSIEHPMYRSGQRQTIPHNIRPICLDGNDVSGFDFWPTAAVAQR